MKAKLQRNCQIPTKNLRNILAAENPAKPTKKGPLLDLYVNKSARPVNTGVSEDILDLYRLRDNAAIVLPNMPVFKCGKIPYERYVKIQKNEKGIKRYGSVSHCGSIWICPTCAFKKTMVRQDQIKEIIRLHTNSGCSFYFVTLTVKHRSDDPLTILLNQVQLAWKQITKEKCLKPLFRAANYIQTLEIRYSGKTGWHPHYHAIFMSTEKEIVKPLFDILVDSWTKKTGSNAANQKIVEAEKEDELAEYILKMGLAKELTIGQAKNSKKDSVSYLEMLKNTNKYRRQIEEYSAATKGCRSLRKSNGLNIISDNEDPKDQVIDTLLNIHKLVYYSTIVKNCDYKKVLENVEQWNWIKEYFKDYRIDDFEKIINPVGRSFNIIK